MSWIHCIGTYHAKKLDNFYVPIENFTSATIMWWKGRMLEVLLVSTLPSLCKPQSLISKKACMFLSHQKNIGFICLLLLGCLATPVHHDCPFNVTLYLHFHVLDNMSLHLNFLPTWSYLFRYQIIKNSIDGFSFPNHIPTMKMFSMWYLNSGGKFNTTT